MMDGRQPARGEGPPRAIGPAGSRPQCPTSDASPTTSPPPRRSASPTWPRPRGQGFTAIICNRPDGEDPGQPTRRGDRTRPPRRSGLTYTHIPFAGPPGPAQVEAMRQAVDAADGPVLAYCRSGTRSITTWAIGQAMSGATRARRAGQPGPRRRLRPLRRARRLSPMIPYVRDIEFEYGACRPGLAADPPGGRQQSRPLHLQGHRHLHRRPGRGRGDRSRPGPCPSTWPPSWTPSRASGSATS